MFTMNCNGRLLVVDKPITMGIINLTPDSFYEASRHLQVASVLKQAEKMLNEGAAVLDLGGQSTRPGSSRISEDEELERVMDPLIEIVKSFPEAFISIDSFYSRVAKEAVMAGAHIVNDISAGSQDPELIKTVAALKVPYILMHMQGEPQTMQKDPSYENVTMEVFDFFITKLAQLRSAGIVDIIIDPGFGFGKTREHNMELLHNLSVFKVLDCPILLGISRKSLISKFLGIPTSDALNGTTVLNTIGLINGVDILRVHDVKEAEQAVKLYMAYCEVAKKKKASR